MNFKPGDTVICVDDHGLPFGMSSGYAYEVEVSSMVPTGPGGASDEFLGLRNIPGRYLAKRFMHLGQPFVASMPPNVPFTIPDIGAVSIVYHPAPDQCPHEWTEYVGFTDRFDYCSKCSVKKSLVNP